jgi:transglutaminase-like putative cysteine protease
MRAPASPAANPPAPRRYVSSCFHSGDPGELASHCWAGSWLDAEQGWLSVDLTHNSLAGERRYRLAIGRVYRNVTPVRGLRSGGAGEALRVAVVVAASAQ